MKRMLLGLIGAAGMMLTGEVSHAQKARPIVAVYQITDVAESGQAASFSAMLETSIGATNRFRVIERQQLDRLLVEQRAARAGVLTSNTAGRVGGIEGADYLIYGSITSAQATQRADVGANILSSMLGGSASSPSCQSANVALGIDVKITDAHTGEIRYATHFNQSQKSATSCNGHPQVDVPTLLRGAADTVATGLVTSIYPIQIAAVQGNSYVLNYGEGTIQPGEILAVYAKGDAIRDPSTGEVLSNSDTRLGYIRVSDVETRVSRAEAVG